MLLGAEKQVEAELSKMKQNVKELPARFGSEASVKIPMSVYNRLMDMAKASGTLSKLNELYERELNKLQGTVTKLRLHIPQELRIRSEGTERHSA